MHALLKLFNSYKEKDLKWGNCVLAGFGGMIPLVEHAKIHSVYQMMASN